MPHPIRLALASVCVAALSACGGNGSSSDKTPTPEPADQVTVQECTTTADGKIDYAKAEACAVVVTRAMNFTVYNSDTQQMSLNPCEVTIADNGDVTVAVPSLGGSARITKSAANRHTYYLNPDQPDEFTYSVWQGTTPSASTPWIDISAPAGSNQVTVIARPFLTGDGKNYYVECKGNLPND